LDDPVFLQAGAERDASDIVAAGDGFISFLTGDDTRAVGGAAIKDVLTRINESVF
jgi:hypothetical protein